MTLIIHKIIRNQITSQVSTQSYHVGLISFARYAIFERNKFGQKEEQKKSAVSPTYLPMNPLFSIHHSRRIGKHSCMVKVFTFHSWGIFWFEDHLIKPTETQLLNYSASLYFWWLLLLLRMVDVDLDLSKLAQKMIMDGRAGRGFQASMSTTLLIGRHWH